MRLRLGYDVKYGARENSNGTLSSYQNIEYLIDSKYKTFRGKFTCEKDGYDGNYMNYDNSQSVIVKIFGDEKLLYTSPPITREAKAVEFEVDISNCKNLRIYADIPNVYERSNSSAIGIVEARLEKK